MESFSIKAELREKIGKKNSQELRNKGYVPCVLYGGKENIHFYTELKTFNTLVYTPRAYFINIAINGKKYDAVMKEIQFHPVTDRIIHVDFIEAHEGEKVKINIPVHLSGVSIGIEE